MGKPGGMLNSSSKQQQRWYATAANHFSISFTLKKSGKAIFKKLLHLRQNAI